ncbi:DUF2199 domain-containing protein (plasmid) [Ralstonia syzygii]|uniref:DUF2199 domain-containing protein n=1 Tax=Ralstonia syzygii TaxID=28097 RepID=A0ABX7ZMZ1_9RALS|nr:DUF2199 domain-containing protein [Ralstonia syzygii]QUP56708.1 DUF2199 domain-containing protein [Ralstonia syzygii]
MAKLRFQCAQCDEWHEGEPSVGFTLPDFLIDIPEQDRDARAWWSEDLCVVDNQFFFVRACMEVPVVGVPEPFLWGIWVSLSERSFTDYRANLESGEVGGPYFSWLGNELPGYPSPVGLKFQTFPQPGNDRPLVRPEVSDHPLSLDFHNGMTEARAKAIFETILHRQRPSH